MDWGIAWKPKRIICWPQPLWSLREARCLLKSLPKAVREAVHIIRWE